jgi:transposase InsO family protein
MALAIGSPLSLHQIARECRWSAKKLRGGVVAPLTKVLDKAGMIQSMSRKGNCWDNAPMESCFGTIKTELVHEACYPTRDAARHDLFAYIEGYYNRQRLHSALGYITPEQAERRAA